MRIIAVANQKGGVGKTTTAQNLGSALTAATGKKALLVDLDGQASLTKASGLNPDEVDPACYDWFKGENFHKVIVELDDYDLIPGDRNSRLLEMEMATRRSREHILRKMLDKVETDHDFCILDCPPDLGFATTNALIAAHEVLVVVQAQPWALDAVLDELPETLDEVRDRTLNPDLLVSGYLLTMYDRRDGTCNSVKNALRKQFGALAFETVIRKNVKLQEAVAVGKSIFQFAPESNGAADYTLFASEYLKKGVVSG